MPLSTLSLCRRRILAAALVASCPLALHAQDVTETRKDVKPATFVSADYSYQSFNGDIDAWQLADISIGRRTTAGSIIARVNYANRFASGGGQLEVDAYPRLTKDMYAYLNVGYSGSSIFPEWRSGAELFASLPGAWEASAGYRQLRFNGSPVTLLTGAVGKYVGDYWFSLRPFVRPKDNGTSASASLTARRYFEDGDHYVGARVGFGSSPTDVVTPDSLTLSRTQAFSAALQGSGDITKGVLGIWTLGYDSEELDSGRKRNSWTAAIGLKVTF
ncbi:MAG: YaiO family outer membrane beta-barrel protein [Gemmatimonadetes bacterium]|nr:YaiO family outer membrane beta-barrel protein [Gemmatimonadota bacterium]